MRRAPRSLPPWIDSYDEKHGAVSNEQLRLLSPPPRSKPAQHNAAPQEPQRRVSKDGFVNWEDTQLGPAQGARAKIPHFLRYGRASMRGRRWDHLRTAEPVIVPGHVAPMGPQPSMTWSEFVHSSSWGRMPHEESEVVDYSVLDKLQPGFSLPVSMPLDPHNPRPSRTKRRLAPYQRIWNVAVRHSLAPLIFRLTVMVTSILALGVGARIYHLENAQDHNSAERTQALVAVVVDCIAIPYIAYMIWDEYTGKPLGLRSVVSKLNLILLDLFFIILKSASTALAFESLVYHLASGNSVRDLAKVLAAFMLVGLISWTMNFTVNIFRIIERLGGGDDDAGLA
jgi:hypothetical protein